MTDLAEVALLFLDVDGTLIPLQRRPRSRGAPVMVDDVGSSPSSINPLLSRLDPADGPRLLALGCAIVWATSWADEANEEISPRLGLPVLPVVSWSDDADDATGGR